MRTIKTLVLLAFLGALAYCGATVQLGKRTFFGHVRAIWHSEPTKDLVDGVKERGGPVVDKLERGVKAGGEEMRKDTHDKGGAGGK